MRTKKILSTGSTLELGYTSFGNCMELLNIGASIIREDIPSFKLDSNLFKKENVEKNKELWQEVLKNFLPILLNAIINKYLLDVVLKCADESLINGDRINKEYFEKPENRKDFFIVLYEVILYNVKAFSPIVAIK